MVAFREPCFCKVPRKYGFRHTINAVLTQSVNLGKISYCISIYNFDMGFSSGPSRGLAELLGYEYNSSNQGVKHSLKDTVAHILDVESDRFADVDVFAGAENVLLARDEEMASQSQDSSSGSEGGGVSSSGSGHAPSSGIVGPPRVTIDRASCQGQLQFSSNDLAAESLNNFSSFRATACVHAGRHMFEATIQTAWQPGIQQVRCRL